MELRLRVTRKRVAVFVAVLALVATGSIGWAAIGDGGTVQGCVANNGTIDAIDPVTQACKDRQTPVEWYTKAGADAAFAAKGDLSSTYLGINAKAADADKLDGKDSTEFLGASAKAADADKLDGIDSTGFYATGSKVADADKLDGFDSTAFVPFVLGRVGYLRFGVDIDAAPVVCRTNAYTPSGFSSVRIDSWVSLSPATSSPMSFTLEPVYSNDGGATWFTLNSGFIPAAGSDQVDIPAEASDVTVAPFASQAVQFGVRIARPYGSATTTDASSGTCKVVVEVTREVSVP